MHTPGPWIYVDSGIVAEESPDEWLIENEDRVFSATDDDLRLMAAAPDLLAACEAALNFFQWNDCNDNPEVAIRREHLQEVIAKAKVE